MEKYVYGVDIGGTNIKFGLFSIPKMELIQKHENSTPLTNHETSVFTLVAETINKINKENNIEISQVEGVGIAVPCPVKNGYVEKCPNLKWEKLDIHSSLSNYLPSGIKIAVSNDANIAAYGENQSLEIPHKNAIFYTLGTGVGGGIIIDGEILEGRTGAGGEIGHMHVFEGTEPCSCGLSGCLEQVCGTSAILKKARELSLIYPTQLNLEKLTVKDVFDYAKSGDTVAMKVVNRIGEYMAISASILSVSLDPDIFIIGGGISKAGDILIDTIKKHYINHARFGTGDIPFVLAKTGNDAGIIGAAYYVAKKNT
ncbi:MAG: glucokinase [Tenericutes bacterium HGW-Tenericutes-2]|jgi:glucokinase|nr:MAG: glucokinase [Tenericutes bacterium HGW-Tenericutes-2]